MSEDRTIPVRVAVRCRPLIEKELKEGCQTCLSFESNTPQVILGKDKAFTYDYTFNSHSPQVDVYEQSVESLVVSVFKGYNATVLAYGQTSSGKTHTMGGCYEDSLRQDEQMMGIIPRVLRGIFAQTSSDESKYQLKVSYLEIHKEDIVDLLCPLDRREALPVREDTQGTIQIPGLQEVMISNLNEAMNCLQRGSHGRSTGATAMNATSSRSHAIFTVHIMKVPVNEIEDDSWKSKFHLVDLAGSERVKKTHAEGDRFKEGVNINKGLLCLGNVISALGDDAQRKGHVPYRNSKLTRILQDSLGGNSHTLMIACVSPADSNMEETLNTLRYADRARKIKNKPIVNRDPNIAEIQRLKDLVHTLQLKSVSEGGDTTASVSVSVRQADVPRELLERSTILEEENVKLTQELQHSVEQYTQMCERNIRLEILTESLQGKIDELKQDTGLDLELLSSSIDATTNPEALKQIKIIANLTEKIKSVQDETQVESSAADTDTTNDESGRSSMTTSGDDKVVSTQYALRQAHLQRELADLNELLSKKRLLAAQMSQNDDRLSSMKQQYETTMKDLESQVDSLNKERESLTQALRDARSNKATSQVSEQRRKRLKELETQMAQVRKKMMEQEKLLKIKSQTDQQVASLNRDIQSMKQQRVKLMKQMKEDADNFRKWKQAKDKEVMQLVQKDRKREFEMVKLQRVNEKQKSVMKRKADEAAAANRRLKEAMSKRKVVTEQRGKKLEKCDSTAIGTRVRELFSNEMDVRVGLKEARYHLDSMLSDRTDLTHQLQILQNRLDNGPSMTKYTAVQTDLKMNRSCEEEELRDRVKELQQDIDLRNTQILDLQQKILDAEQDGKGNAMWDNSVHTMMEAKCALKWLMEQAVMFKADLGTSHGALKDSHADLQESRNDCDVMKDTYHQCEVKIKDLKRAHDEELMKAARSNEEKILFLLRVKDDDTATSDSVLRDKLKFQRDEIERLSQQYEKLTSSDVEIEDLKRQLKRAMYGNKKLSLMPELTPGGTRKPPLLTKERNPRPSQPQFDEPSDSEGSENDDDDKDTDWVRTPMNKRPTRPSILNKGCCSCRGQCSTKACGCRRGEKFCKEECRCVEETCVNREAPLPESTTEGETSTLNSTFTKAVEEVTELPKPTITEVKNVRKTLSKGKIRKIDELHENKLEDFDTEISQPAKILRKSRSKTDLSSDDILFMKPLAKSSEVMIGGLRRKRKLAAKSTSGLFFNPPS